MIMRRPFELATILDSTAPAVSRREQSDPIRQWSGTWFSGVPIGCPLLFIIIYKKVFITKSLRIAGEKSLSGGSLPAEHPAGYKP
jgi:hypothetical protein